MSQEESAEKGPEEKASLEHNESKINIEPAKAGKRYVEHEGSEDRHDDAPANAEKD